MHNATAITVRETLRIGDYVQVGAVGRAGVADRPIQMLLPVTPGGAVRVEPSEVVRPGARYAWSPDCLGRYRRSDLRSLCDRTSTQHRHGQETDEQAPAS